MKQKMNIAKIGLWLTLVLIPIITYASTGSNFIPTAGLYGIVLFTSIHMTVFVIIPLGALFGEEKKWKAVIVMSAIRLITLFVVIPFHPEIFMIDFFAIFVGAFLIVPIASILSKKNLYDSAFGKSKTISTSTSSSIKEEPEPSLSDGSIDATWNASTMKEATVDRKYFISDNDYLSNIIKAELKKQNSNGRFSTPYINQRKQRISMIYAMINFIAISFIFFHFPLIWSILLEILSIPILLIVSSKYNVKHYIMKEVTARPDEKISNIVGNIIHTSVTSNRTRNLCAILISFILPLIIFYHPHILYEYNKEEKGYFVRFYTVGITNQSTVDIPEKYKGKPVVGIRGNVFANMKNLTKVELPNSIRIIRGNAFKNDVLLRTISLPEELTYLGGSAFKNCLSLESILIPKNVTEIQGETFKECDSLKEVVLHDGITDIHGEAFSGCNSLKEIDLPPQITEIHGNTFEYCSSLTRIEIPEGVTRIGGHAFYGCTSLSEVILPQSLLEIGSSAFRQCYSLREIRVPDYTFINERAFKESPTVILNTDQYGNEFNQYTSYGDEGEYEPGY